MRQIALETHMGIMRLATAAALAALSLAPRTPARAADVPPGAASCSGCHPAHRLVDTAVPRLVGRNPDELVAAMQAFKSGQREATVMDRIAKGFSEDEIKAIAAWYAAQKD
jgi:cytochrome subunit of sulfide dehydrogenase